MKNSTTTSLILLIKYIVCALVVIAFTGADLYAQNTGRVTGQVIDQATGEPMIGVNIVLQGTTQGAITDLEGYYFILNIEPGNYNVVASMIGFARVTVENVRVSMNENTVINFELAEETIIGEELVISAPREVVRLDQSQSRTLVRAEDMGDQAVSNLEEVLSTFPGITLTAGADGTGLVIRGGNINETDIMVDGLSTRDMRTQQPNTTLNLTAINELEVLSGGFTAEHGGIRSGMVTVRTKDGRMDKYEAVVDFRISPPQRKHFGPSPYSTDGPYWQVYAGDHAMTGISQEMVNTGQYPFTWVGWNEFSRQRLADGNPTTDVTPQEALEIWKWQHRRIEYANKPDYIMDMTLSGPVTFLPETSFMISQRYDDLQLAYPMSRNNAVGSSSLVKFTTRMSGGRRLSVNAGYLARLGVGNGLYATSTGVVDGTRQGTSFARNAFQRDAMWHTAAVNPVDTRHFRAGVQYNHALSQRTYYEVAMEYTQYRTRQEPKDMRDTSCLRVIGERCYDEAPFGYLSSEVGRIGEQYDILGDFLTSGGGRGRDNSSYWTGGTSFTLTSQLNRHNQIKVGADFEYAYYRERQEVNHGESTTPRELSPQLWTYFDSNPINASAFIQNRMEYGSMIANIGVRVDYMNYGERPYNLDPDFIYAQLPYNTTSYRDSTNSKYLSFSHLQTSNSNVSKIYISPRLGVSHPITTSSKVFFNYGHFYQPPVLDQLYTVTPTGTGATIPNLEAAWPRTISYELGFEVGIADNYLISFTGYYKDVQNQLSRQTIVSRNRDQNINTFNNNSYADIRGIELRLQKITGQWFRGWSSLEYSTRSTGFTGFRYLYEDPLLVRDQRESTNQQRQEPRPSVSANLIFTSPPNLGPRILGNYPLGAWRLAVRQSWTDGGKYLLNPDARVGERLYVPQIDSWNTDVQLNKEFRVGSSVIGFFAQVTNLTNYRGFPRAQNSIRYRESLRFPFYSGERKGNDRWGEWDKDHIDLGYYTWNQFINPRHFTFGIRMQI